MKITFVAIGWENLTISLLSAIAKQEGHQPGLAFSAGLFHDRYNLCIKPLASLFDDTQTVLNTIKKQKPDVLACSTFTANYQWMLHIAQETKKIFPQIKIIFGGIHASAIGKRIFTHPQIDYVCIGEGDYAFPAILNHIKEKDDHTPIANTIFRDAKGNLIQGPQKGFIQDLDTLPIFDKTIWEEHVDLSKIYFTLATRGCPYSCAYCFNSFYSQLHNSDKKNYIRQRSPAHMLKELTFAKKRYNLKIIEFEDDVFTLNQGWLQKFLIAYKKEIHLPFQCLSHPTYMNDAIAKLLADAGCIFVQMGIQSMDDKYKRNILKRTDTERDVVRALQSMKKYNIQVKADHMLGLPDEPLEAQKKAKDIYLKYPPYRIQTFWINYMPKTEMTTLAFSKGLIDKTALENILEGKGSDFYRNSHILDEKKRKTLKSYELLFKLIPILPVSVSRKINPVKLTWIPAGILSCLGFMADALNGLLKKNPDHHAYARYYAYHLYKFFLTKLRITPPPATKLKKIKREGEITCE